MPTNYEHWEIAKDAQHFFWLKLNRKGSTLNTLGQPVVAELEKILLEVMEQDPAGIVFFSGKKSSFIAGADIHELKKINSYDAAQLALKRVHQLFREIEHLSIPTVALIHGVCLGGGLELALSCRYRIAVEDEKTKIGLPEINLGIYPGWGGSVRLPRRIGALKALPLILNAKIVNAKTAKKLGIVDLVIPERHAMQAAIFYLSKKPAQSHPAWWNTLIETPLCRKWFGKIFLKKVSEKISEPHYPAPFALVNTWIENGSLSENALQKEIEVVAKLMMTPTHKNLVRVFTLQEQLKSLGKTAECGIHHVHVVGAGTMGGDIAAWCALQGFTVTLQDQTPERLSPAIQRASKLFSKKLHEPELQQAAFDRLVPDVQGFGVEKADLIIEAIFEDLEVKRNLFKMIEKKAKKTAIFATNTSSIPLDDIASVLSSPTRLVGIHFFNPVARMQLVEVISGKHSDPQAAQQALSFVGKLGKLPLPVKSSPGFLVNRVLMPYLLAAMNLLDKGYSIGAIDAGALAFGMPMGPILLADTVGLDVCLAVAENLSKYWPCTIPERLKTMVQNKQFGAKTGQGFYQYHHGKPVRLSAEPLDQKMVIEQLIMPMIQAAKACLQEGVVASADLVDAGLIFGTGFAPFRGGPLHYLTQEM